MDGLVRGGPGAKRQSAFSSRATRRARPQCTFCRPQCTSSVQGQAPMRFLPICSRNFQTIVRRKGDCPLSPRDAHPHRSCRRADPRLRQRRLDRHLGRAAGRGLQHRRAPARERPCRRLSGRHPRIARHARRPRPVEPLRRVVRPGWMGAASASRGRDSTDPAARHRGRRDRDSFGCPRRRIDGDIGGGHGRSPRRARPRDGRRAIGRGDRQGRARRRKRGSRPAERGAGSARRGVRRHQLHRDYRLSAGDGHAAECRRARHRSPESTIRADLLRPSAPLVGRAREGRARSGAARSGLSTAARRSGAPR